MIRLLICEDQTLLRQSLATMLGLEQGIEVVGEASNGSTALEQVEALHPDIVLMDVQMPIVDGVEATRAISARHPDTRVIILSTYDTEEYVFEGVKAGAMGYLLKDAPAPELVEIIQRVHAGERFIQPAVAHKILSEFAKPGGQTETSSAEYEPLTDREVMIISCLARGLTNRQIAQELSLAEGTVRNYTSNILTKLHVANRVQAINLARRHKLI